ncbi:MAG: flippase [Methanosphaera stadtmanae]|nr:flippase [Methanosphaera stadtmanae]
MSVTTRVIKNSGLLMLASLIANIMTFILTLFTARYLGTANFGIISSATSMVGIFGILCDLGLSTYAIREVARDKSNTSVYFGTTLLFRALFTLITFLGYVVFILYNKFTADTTYVMILFGFYMIFNSFTTFYYSLYQSNEKMQYQTISNSIYSTLVLIISLIMIYYGMNVVYVAASYPIAMLLTLVYNGYIGFSKYPKFTVNLEKGFVKNLFVKGIPFGITVVFTSIYFWIALIILTFIGSSVDVGLFSSSQKLLIVLGTIFGFLSNAIFPVMSQLHTEDRDKLAKLYHKMMKYLLVLGLAIAVGTCLLSEDIIVLIYGASFVDAAPSLSILIWAGVFMFLTSGCTTLLGAINKQFTVTKIAAIGALVSVVVNSILISVYSFIGASYATVITEFTMIFLMLLVLSRTEYSISPRKAILPIIQIILANIIMAAVVIYLNQSFIISVPIAIVVYVIALFITGTVNKEDREIIKDLIKDIRS